MRTGYNEHNSGEALFSLRGRPAKEFSPSTPDGHDVPQYESNDVKSHRKGPHVVILRNCRHYDVTFIKIKNL